MVRELKITISVNEQEKKLIRANAKLNKYKSMAGFMRDRALEIDLSNKGHLAILMTWLSSHMGDFTKDKALDWTRKKAEIKSRLTSELFGMNKVQKDAYMTKLEKTLDTALEIKEELDNILGKYYIES